MKTTTVQSVGGLVDHLLSQEDRPVRWFRGHGCDQRLLKPSLVRKLSPFEPAKLMKTERRLITRFRQRSLPFWPDGYAQLDWEHLFAMQHFGVPTRLLDWSENALVAVYFAADHDPGRCECGTLMCTPTVWALNPVLLNQKNSRLDGYGDALGVLATSDEAVEPWAPGTEETRFAPWPVAIYGTHNSTRIVAQQGTFTVAGKADVGLEEAPAVTENEEVLEKIVLDCDRAQLSRQLRLLGLTRATVFPDLTGVAHDIAIGEME